MGARGPAPRRRREGRAWPIHPTHRKDEEAENRGFRLGQSAGSWSRCITKQQRFCFYTNILGTKTEGGKLGASDVPKQAELPEKEVVVAALWNGNLSFRGCGRGSRVVGLWVLSFGGSRPYVGPGYNAKWQCVYFVQWNPIGRQPSSRCCAVGSGQGDRCAGHCSLVENVVALFHCRPQAKLLSCFHFPFLRRTVNAPSRS